LKAWAICTLSPPSSLSLSFLPLLRAQGRRQNIQASGGRVSPFFPFPFFFFFPPPIITASRRASRRPSPPACSAPSPPFPSSLSLPAIYADKDRLKHASPSCSRPSFTGLLPPPPFLLWKNQKPLRPRPASPLSSLFPLFSFPPPFFHHNHGGIRNFEQVARAVQIRPLFSPSPLLSFPFPPPPLFFFSAE